MGHIANCIVSNQWNKNTEDELFQSASKTIKEIIKCADSFKGVCATDLGITRVEKKDNKNQLLHLEFHFKIALEKRGNSVHWNMVLNAIKRIKPCRFTRS